VSFEIVQGPKGLHALKITNVIIEPSSPSESAAFGAAAAAAAATAKA
jgi:CspA family cold shock protein